MASSLISFFQMNLFNIVSLLTSVFALVIAISISSREEATNNSWEVYRSYNEAEVREGRAVALRILRNTAGVGFLKREDFVAYFGVSVDESPTPERARERQYYYDLASFYHHTGLLLIRKRIDKGFTLELVGPGLRDRWNVYQAIGNFYPEEYAYGGIYYLYEQYLKWQKAPWVRLRRRFNSSYNKFKKNP